MFLVLGAAVTLPPVHCACLLLLLCYALEALSGAPLGLFVSTYLLISATIVLLRRFYNFNTLVELFGLLLMSLAVKYIVLYFFLVFVYEYHYSDMFQTVLRETCFTIILFPLVFPLLKNALNREPESGSMPVHSQSHDA